MIEVVYTFFKRNVGRNAAGILQTTHPYLSGLLAAGLAQDQLGFEPIKMAPVVAAFVTYDTVVFGFTATAIALAIAIPNARFLKFLSSIKDKTTPFRDFLFILAWNGFAHIIAFFVLAPLIFKGEFTLDSSSTPNLRLYMFMFEWVQLYAIFQFMVTTLSVYEIADLYANYISRHPPDDEK